MGRLLKGLFLILITIFIFFNNGVALVGPIRVLPSGHVLLVSCDDIKLSEEHIELYHHPLGIWLVEYRVLLINLRSLDIEQPVGFPSGFDLRIIEGEFQCDRFENFKVFINDQQTSRINYKVKCSNYVSTTGTQWSLDDGSGTGFLNTWDLKFKPDEQKWIKVTFSFIVKNVSSIYNPSKLDTWYVDLMNWLKLDYAAQDENSFKLPINIGSFWAFYPDSIMIRTYVSKEWLKVISKSERKYQPEFTKKYEYSEPVGFYSPPPVVLDSLSVERIQGMTPTELILLRNSFFAKYGKRFENAVLKKYFTAQPWYSENPEFHQWYLTQWDINNIKLIHEFEESKIQNKTTSRKKN